MGRPAMPRASRSRRAVRSDTSSSAATSAAVTWPRVCRSMRMATKRSARMLSSSQRNRPEGDRFTVGAVAALGRARRQHRYAHADRQAEKGGPMSATTEANKQLVLDYLEAYCTFD